MLYHHFKPLPHFLQRRGEVPGDLGIRHVDLAVLDSRATKRGIVTLCTEAAKDQSTSRKVKMEPAAVLR